MKLTRLAVKEVKSINIVNLIHSQRIAAMKKIILIIVFSIVLFSACASNKPFRPEKRMTWGEIKEELKKRNIDIGNNHN